MKCKHCGSKNYCKAGFDNGHQRYKCKECSRVFTNTPPRGRPKEEKLKAFQLYSEGMGYRAIGRFLRVSHVSVQQWIDQLTPELCPDPTIEKTKHPVVEIDEMWHFVEKKQNKLWIWKVLDKFTGHLVHYECGNCSASSVSKIIENLSKRGVIFYHTDGYSAYRKVIDPERLYQGKDQTHLIESNNARMRHYFARFKRRTCVVSRKVARVIQAIRIFSAKISGYI